MVIGNEKTFFFVNLKVQVEFGSSHELIILMNVARFDFNVILMFDKYILGLSHSFLVMSVFVHFFLFVINIRLREEKRINLPVRSQPIDII